MQRTQFAQPFANLAKLAASVWPRNWRDVDGPAEDSRVVVEPVPQPVGGQAAAAFGEQEVGWSAEPGDGAGPAGAAQGDPFVQGGQGGRVERHGPLGGELAERHFQPAAVAGRVPHAVHLEVEPCSRVHRSFALTYS